MQNDFVNTFGLGTVVLATADASELQPLFEALYLRWQVIISQKVFITKVNSLTNLSTYHLLLLIKMIS